MSAPAAPKPEPESLAPLRKRLKETFARKLWSSRPSGIECRLEFWVTRKSQGYIVQIWDDGTWAVWDVIASAEGEAADLDKIV